MISDQEKRQLEILRDRKKEVEKGLSKRFSTQKTKDFLKKRLKDIDAGIEVLEKKLREEEEMIAEGKVEQLAARLGPKLKGLSEKEGREKVREAAQVAGVDYVKLMKIIEKHMFVREDEEDGAIKAPEQDVAPEVEPEPTDVPEPTDTGGDFSDLDVDPATAKALDRLEGKFGLRPDFDVGGHPGFYASSEKEWYSNMKADRVRMRFKSDGKISQFMRKHPHANFYVRNPNKSSDFMYPATRKKPTRGRS